MYQGFDEPFGFAVDSWCVRPGALGAQPQGLTGLPPDFGAVGAALCENTRRH